VALASTGVTLELALEYSCDETRFARGVWKNPETGMSCCDELFVKLAEESVYSEQLESICALI
jgi:hypothetical protein